MGKQRSIFIKDDRVKLYRSETNYIYDACISIEAINRIKQKRKEIEQL